MIELRTNVGECEATRKFSIACGILSVVRKLVLSRYMVAFQRSFCAREC